MYASWIGALEKQERVFREVAKVSMLLDAQRSANDGASKRTGWILSSLAAKERVRWVGILKMVAVSTSGILTFLNP